MEYKLHDYFLGKLSGEEKENLFGVLKTDFALRKRFIELQHTYSTANMLPAADDEEYARKGMSELRARVRAKNLRRTYLRISRYAAAVVVAATVGIGLTRYLSAPEKLEYAETPAGKRMELLLSDGTKVWLAPCSKLVYPATNKGKVRGVELTGEALFDVAHDADAPFEVRSGDFNVTVLGTVFNISAYGDSFEATLVEGAVEVYSTTCPEEKITLRPNQYARSNGGRLESGETDASWALGLQKGIYNFENMTFGEIVAKLEVWYDVDIEILDRKLEYERFAAKFREGDDIETILRALQKTSEFEFRRDASGAISIYVE
jgi:ferric-dicitrate binding protein FerR (iron transport regulator)